MSVGTDTDSDIDIETETGTDGDVDTETAVGGSAALPEGEEVSPLERRVWESLDEIPDPHIPVSLVEMAMIYDVEVADGQVRVEMTYPCMGCPGYEMIQNDIRSVLVPIDGVESVDIDVVWDPVWSKQMLSADAREKLREAGIGL